MNSPISTAVLAQTNSKSPSHDLFDRWILPVGQWFDQALGWIDQNGASQFEAIQRPFNFVVEGLTDFMTDTRWYVVCLIVFAIGLVVRNAKVALVCVAALMARGFMGTSFWYETMRTFAQMTTVVLLSAMLGIPLGHLIGTKTREDGYLRRLVIVVSATHPFALMLPVIFLFSFGSTPGVMVTLLITIPAMALAVESGARNGESGAWALYGKPSVLVGLQRTVFLGMIGLGVASVMGAGGLGLLVFRAVSTLDVALAFSGGTAFGLVTFVIYQLTQPRLSDGGLFPQIGRRWGYRPPSGIENDGQEIREKVAASRLERAHLPMVAASVMGAAFAVGSLFMTWGSEAGLISGWGKLAHQDKGDLVGVSSNGWAPGGGAAFGWLVAVGATIVVLGVVASAAGSTTRQRPANAIVLGAGLSLGASAGYLLANPSAQSGTFEQGPGPTLAIAASVLMLIGGLWWNSASATQATDALASRRTLGLAAASSFAVLILFGSMFAGWSFDKRANTIFSEELQAELDEVYRQVESGELSESIAAQTIQRLNNSAIRNELIVINGETDEGSGLGRVSLGFGAIAWLGAVAATFGQRSKFAPLLLSVTVAAGTASAAVGLSWILTLLGADGRFYSGIGAALAVAAGLLVASRALRETRELPLAESDAIVL